MKPDGVTFIISLCLGFFSYKLFRTWQCNFGGKEVYFVLFSLESTRKYTNERIIISLKRKESFKGLIEEGKCLSGLKE